VLAVGCVDAARLFFVSRRAVLALGACSSSTRRAGWRFWRVFREHAGRVGVFSKVFVNTPAVLLLRGVFFVNTPAVLALRGAGWVKTAREWA